MGAAQSSPDATSQQVFSASAPIRFSEGIVDSLQKSTNSDTTRAKTNELHIQQRVQEELKKLQKTAEDKLATASEKVSSEPFKPATKPKKQEGASPTPAKGASWTEKPLLNRIGDSIFGSKETASQQGSDQIIDSDKVSEEINALKRKFGSRRQIVETDKSVAKAKEELVSCLRLNDRRPLDCWQEVETFKTEVGRLERAFVEKNGR